MKHIFIVNPVAGKENKLNEVILKTADYFKNDTDKYEIFETKYAGHATEIAKMCCENNKKLRIYSVGGDGTLSEIINGVYGYDNVSVGVYPIGTGNDFIKTAYGIVPSLTELINGEVKVCDLIKVNNIIGINIASAGFDAEVCRRLEIFKKRYSGKTAYTLSLLYSLLFNIKSKFKITIDDNPPIEQNYLLAVAANGKYYGGGFYPAPLSIMNDGYLDFVTIKSVSRIIFLSIIKSYSKGDHMKYTKLVTYQKGKKMTVEAKKDFSVNIDGEVHLFNKVVFEVLPNAIEIIIPKIESL